MLLFKPALVTNITYRKNKRWNWAMSKRQFKLRALRNLSVERLRIARPGFAPDGPRHALRRAVDMLGPFPATTIFEGRLLERPEAQSFCEHAGHLYFQHLVEEQTAPRLPEVLENLGVLRDLSRDLAKALAHLGYAERYLLQTVWGIYPEARQQQLASMLDDFGDYGPPTTEDVGNGQSLAPGLLSETLHSLGEYAEGVRYIVHRRYSRPGSANVDRGGSTSAANIIAPNPRWHLIDNCREMFVSTLGRQLGPEEGTPFQQFVTAIHEWITNDSEGSFVGPLREYSGLWRRRVKLAAELENLSVAYAPEAAPVGPRRTKIRGRVSQRMATLRSQLAFIDDTLSHGHRIPCRQIVTG